MGWSATRFRSVIGGLRLCRERFGINASRGGLERCRANGLEIRRRRWRKHGGRFHRGARSICNLRGPLLASRRRQLIEIRVPPAPELRGRFADNVLPRRSRRAMVKLVAADIELCQMHWVDAALLKLCAIGEAHDGHGGRSRRSRDVRPRFRDVRPRLSRRLPLRPPPPAQLERARAAGSRLRPSWTESNRRRRALLARSARPSRVSRSTTMILGRA